MEPVGLDTAGPWAPVSRLGPDNSLATEPSNSATLASPRPQTEQAAARPRTPGRLPGWAKALSRRGYAPKAPAVAVVIMAITALRLHELYPPLERLRPAMIAAVVGLGYILPRTKASVLRSIWKDPTLRWIAAFVGWCAVTVPFAYWPGGAYFQLRGMLLAAIPPVIAILLSVPLAASLQTILRGGLLALTVYALAVLSTGQAALGGRAEAGHSLDPNDTALMLAALTPFACGMFVRSRGTQRWGAALAIAIFAVGAMATGSRGGTIALVVAIGVFLMGFRGQQLLYAAVISLVGAVTAWNFASDSYRQRMVDLVQGQEDYNYTDYDGRLAVWRRARGYALDHPVLGLGIGNFPVAEGNALGMEGRVGKWSVAHNSYLNAFAELGMPGGILFIGILASSARRALKYWRQSRTRRGGRRQDQHMPELLAGLAGFAAGAMFLSATYSSLMFCLFAIVALADRVFTMERMGKHADIARGLKH